MQIDTEFCQLNEINISPIEDFDIPYYEMKLVKSLINGIYQVSTRLQLQWHAVSSPLCRLVVLIAGAHHRLEQVCRCSPLLPPRPGPPPHHHTTASTAAAAELANTDSELFNDNDDNNKHLAATRELGDNPRGHTNPAAEATLQLEEVCSSQLYLKIYNILRLYSSMFM